MFRHHYPENPGGEASSDPRDAPGLKCQRGVRPFSRKAGLEIEFYGLAGAEPNKAPVTNVEAGPPTMAAIGFDGSAFKVSLERCPGSLRGAKRTFCHVRTVYDYDEPILGETALGSC